MAHTTEDAFPRVATVKVSDRFGAFTAIHLDAYDAHWLAKAINAAITGNAPPPIPTETVYGMVRLVAAVDAARKR